MNDGGPAFPTMSGERGMSLREFFASQEAYPPPDVLEQLRLIERDKMIADTTRLSQQRSNAALVAEWRFRMADAMIKEAE